VTESRRYAAIVRKVQTNTDVDHIATIPTAQW